MRVFVGCGPFQAASTTRTCGPNGPLWWPPHLRRCFKTPWRSLAASEICTCKLTGCPSCPRCVGGANDGLLCAVRSRGFQRTYARVCECVLHKRCVRWCIRLSAHTRKHEKNRARVLSSRRLVCLFAIFLKLSFAPLFYRSLK